MIWVAVSLLCAAMPTQGQGANSSAAQVVQQFLAATQEADYAQAYELLSERDRSYGTQRQILALLKQRPLPDSAYLLEYVNAAGKVAEVTVIEVDSQERYAFSLRQEGTQKQPTWRLSLDLIEQGENARQAARVTAWLDAAEIFYERKNFERSAAIYTRVLNVVPEHADAKAGLKRSLSRGAAPAS